MQSKDKITVTNPMKIGQPAIVTEDYDQNGWKFIFKKSGILPSKEIDQLADDLNLQGIPDVVYGNSIAQLVFEGKNFVYEISPRDSLSFINIAKQKAKYQENLDKTFDTETINVLTPDLKIKQAEFWKNKKVAEGTEIKTLEKISDWTYSTPYKGTARQFKASESANQDVTTGIENLSLNPKHEISIEKTEEEIPLSNLTANNPIKWFNEFLLFEDELGDCGLSQSTFRFRVMGDCFFGLVRHYLRVDDVCVRIYDTRLYHEFGKNYILREFTVRENTFDELKHKGFKFGAEFITNHRQSDVIYPSLELRSTFRDKVFF